MQKKIKIILSVLLCVGVSGCAHTSSRSSNMASSVNDMHLKGLNDNQALVLFHRIYNEPVQTQLDETAKDITITAFMIALKSRRSRVIRESGALQEPYKKVQLHKWTDDDLLNFYDSLSAERRKQSSAKKQTGNKKVEETMDREGRVYWAFKPLPETEKKEAPPPGKEDRTTLEIIQLTALYAADGEMNRRANVKSAWKAVGTATMAGITTAAQVAIMLAGAFLL